MRSVLICLVGAAGLLATAATPALARPWLEGVTSADLIKTYQQTGLRCAGPTVEETRLKWTCKGKKRRATVSVEFVGLTRNYIEYLTATVQQSGTSPDDRIAAAFLGSVATLPYDAAEPRTARRWVEEQIANGGETVIGTARFRLFGSPGARSLDIQAVGSDFQPPDR